MDKVSNESVRISVVVPMDMRDDMYALCGYINKPYRTVSELVRMAIQRELELYGSEGIEEYRSDDYKFSEQSADAYYPVIDEEIGGVKGD